MAVSTALALSDYGRLLMAKPRKTNQKKIVHGEPAACCWGVAGVFTFFSNFEVSWLTGVAGSRRHH